MAVAVTSREHIKLYTEINLHDRIKERLRGSGFEVMFRQFDRVLNNLPLLCALIDKYNANTKTFRIGQHNIFFGLEDVLVLTGLPIDGKPVILEKEMMYMNDDECLSLLGVRTYSQGKKCGYVATRDLKAVVNQFPGVDDNGEELLRACRAAALLGIHCLFNSDGGCSGISSKYVHLLKEVDQIKDYAWGAAAWVQVHSSFQNAKVSGPNTNMFGCLLALEACIFIRVPGLVKERYKFDLSNLNEFPLMHAFWSQVSTPRCYNAHDFWLKDRYLEFFENNPEVILEPYKNSHDVFPDHVMLQFPLRASETICIFCKFAVPHQPQVSVAQLTDQEMDILCIDMPAVTWGRPKKHPKGMVGPWLEWWTSRWENLILGEQINEDQSEQNCPETRNDASTSHPTAIREDASTSQPPVTPFVPQTGDGLMDETATLNIVTENDELATRLAYFANDGRLSSQIIDQALDYFSNNRLRSNLWLLMSEERQVLYLQDLFS